MIRTMKSGLPLVLAGGLLWAGGVQSANIAQRTAMVCVPDESRYLIAFGDRDPGERAASGVRSRFGRWLFSGERSIGSSEIRFLWVPEGSSGPTLKVHTTQTHHILVDVRSQGRDSVVAVSSASDPLTVVGWLFSINFKLEQVMAASVHSNRGGLKSESMSLSCSFESKTPETELPAPGNNIG